MSTRTARTLGISLVVLYVVLETTALVLVFLTDQPQGNAGGLQGAVGGGVVLGIWALAGALIASRHPRNAIGWVLCGIALTWSLQDLAWGYAQYALTRPDSLPGGALAAVGYNAVFFLAMPL